MKFRIAGVIAGILILGIFIFIWSVDSEVYNLAKAHGLENQNLENYGTELTSGQMQRLQISSMLRMYQLPLSILILCTSFVIAYLCGNSTQPIENEKSAMNEQTSSS